MKKGTFFLKKEVPCPSLLILSLLSGSLQALVCPQGLSSLLDPPTRVLHKALDWLKNQVYSVPVLEGGNISGLKDLSARHPCSAIQWPLSKID